MLLPNLISVSQRTLSAKKELGRGTKNLGCMNFTMFSQYLVALADNFSPSPHPYHLTFLDQVLSRQKQESVARIYFPKIKNLKKQAAHEFIAGYRAYSISQGLVKNELGCLLQQVNLTAVSISYALLKMIQSDLL
jgi:hypothetical protein